MRANNLNKVYFIDLDGTLLNDKKELDVFNEIMLEKAHKNGNKVVIVTERGIEFVNSLGLGKYLVFANNGAAVFENGKMIDVTPLRESTIKTVLRLHPNNTVIEYGEDEPVAALTTFETPEKAQFFVDWMTKNSTGRFYFWKDGKTVETTAAGVNKEAAFGYMLENIPYHKLVLLFSFGDELSDVKLAERVNLAIAPNTVDPEAMGAFDYVARMTSNDNYVGHFIALSEAKEHETFTPRHLLKKFMQLDIEFTKFNS